MMESLPLDGDVLILAGGRANVMPDRLVPLVRRAQAYLGPRFEDSDRFECVHAADARSFSFPAVTGPNSASRRRRRTCYAAQNNDSLRVGSDTDRRDEFETAMEIREAVVIGRRTPLCAPILRTNSRTRR